jgi:hypothetical protein
MPVPEEVIHDTATGGVDTPNTQDDRGIRLMPRHLDELRRSGITDDVIRELGPWSATKPHELRAIGFDDRQAQLVPALVLPSTSADGRIHYQIKPDHPRRDQHGKPRKYENPTGATVPLFIPARTRAVLADPTRPIIITEGWKKVAAALSAGMTPIGVAGVWMATIKDETGRHRLRDDWDSVTLSGRTLPIIFDNDATTKEGVRQALAVLAPLLEERGASVHIALLPDIPGLAKVGLDDYLTDRDPELRKAEFEQYLWRWRDAINYLNYRFPTVRENLISARLTQLMAERKLDTQPPSEAAEQNRFLQERVQELTNELTSMRSLRTDEPSPDSGNQVSRLISDTEARLPEFWRRALLEITESNMTSDEVRVRINLVARGEAFGPDGVDPEDEGADGEATYKQFSKRLHIPFNRAREAVRSQARSPDEPESPIVIEIRANAGALMPVEMHHRAANGVYVDRYPRHFIHVEGRPRDALRYIPKKCRETKPWGGKRDGAGRKPKVIPCPEHPTADLIEVKTVTTLYERYCSVDGAQVGESESTTVVTQKRRRIQDEALTSRGFQFDSGPQSGRRYRTGHVRARGRNQVSNLNSLQRMNQRADLSYLDTLPARTQPEGGNPIRNLIDNDWRQCPRCGGTQVDAPRRAGDDYRCSACKQVLPGAPKYGEQVPSFPNGRSP